MQLSPRGLQVHSKQQLFLLLSWGQQWREGPHHFFFFTHELHLSALADGSSVGFAEHRMVKSCPLARLDSAVILRLGKRSQNMSRKVHALYHSWEGSQSALWPPAMSGCRPRNVCRSPKTLEKVTVPLLFIPASPTAPSSKTMHPEYLQIMNRKCSEAQSLPRILSHPTAGPGVELLGGLRTNQFLQIINISPLAVAILNCATGNEWIIPRASEGDQVAGI